MSKIFSRINAEDVLAEAAAMEAHAGYVCVNLDINTFPVKQEDKSVKAVTTCFARKDSAEWNRSTSAIKLWSVAKVRLGDTVKPVKRFTFSELHLTINARGSIHGNQVAPAAWMYRATFAYDTVDCHWYCYARKDGADLYYSLDGELKEITVKEWQSHVEYGLVYNDNATFTGANASAGNTKRHKLICSCMNEEGYNYLRRSIEATGAISILYANPGRLKDAKSTAQANIRESAPYTASFAGPRVKVVATYMGKWTLRDSVTGKEFSGADGWFSVRNGLVREYLESLGYQVMNEEAVTGIACQARPFAYKGVFSTMPKWFNVDMITRPEGLCHGAEVVVKRASEIDRTFQKDYQKAIDSKGTKGDLAGKVVVIVYDDDIEVPENSADFDLGLIDLLGDLNAQKAEQDLQMPSSLNILKVFRKRKSAWKNGMGTSTQLLQSLMPVCPNLRGLVRAGFSAQMDKAVQDIMREEAPIVTSRDVLSAIKMARPMDADEVAAMDLSDMERSIIENSEHGMNVVQLAEKLAPAYCREKDAALFKDELKAACKAGKSRADRVRVPIDGTDFVLVPDFAAFYGTPILSVSEEKHHECYNKLMNGFRVKNAVGCKYPKQHIGEIARLETLSDETIANRLAGNENASKIAYLYACITEAALLVACVSSLMNQEAGMDFDGDEMFVTAVLTEAEKDERIEAIDWEADKAAAMQEYVKVMLAYFFGLVQSLVVRLDDSVKDRKAKQGNTDLRAAGDAASFEAPKPTVDVTELWKEIKLGDNMPSRQEMEAKGIMNPGNEASIRNILNANLDVGVVTVIHLIFADLWFKMKRFEGKSDDELTKDEQRDVEVARAIMVEVFGNQEEAGKKYVPLRYFKDEVGLNTVDIDINKYHDIRESATTMELSRVNMMAFFYDLIANGRMAQEFTIDAAKTLMRVANIDYAADLRRLVKLLSRDRNMDIELDYKVDGKSDVVITYPKNGRKTGILTKPMFDKKIKRYVNKVNEIIVRDWAYDLREESYNAVVKAIKPLLAIKPGFDGDLIKDIMDLATANPEAAKLAAFFKVTYMHLNTSQEAKLKEIERGSGDRNDKMLAKSEIKREYAGFFNALGNSIRRGLKAFEAKMRNVKDENGGRRYDENGIAALKAALLIGLAYNKNGKVDSKLSSFAYRALPEEYMRFILDYVCADDDRVARFTTDALEWVDSELVNDGDMFPFKDGEGMNGDICVARAKDNLNGVYTIIKEDDKFIASTDVLDLMPLQQDSKSLIVETKLNDWMDSHFDYVLDQLAPDSEGHAATLQLWAKKTQGQDGDEIFDTMAVKDDQGSIGVGYFHVGNGKDATFGLYNGVEGEVTNVITYESKQKKGQRTVLILLENVRKADEREYVVPVDEELEVDDGYEERKQSRLLSAVKAEPIEFHSVSAEEELVEEAETVEVASYAPATTDIESIVVSDDNEEEDVDGGAWDYSYDDEDECVG